MNRPSQFPPLTALHVGSRRLRSVRPMTGAEIISLTGDTKAAYRHDVLDHGDAKYCEPADIIGTVTRSIRKQHRAYKARNAAIIASHPEGQVFADELRRFAGKPRHVRIEPPIDWSRVANAFCIALAVGCIVYFAGQCLRVVLS